MLNGAYGPCLKLASGSTVDGDSYSFGLCLSSSGVPSILLKTSKTFLILPQFSFTAWQQLLSFPTLHRKHIFGQCSKTKINLKKKKHFKSLDTCKLNHILMCQLECEGLWPFGVIPKPAILEVIAREWPR